MEKTDKKNVKDIEVTLAEVCKESPKEKQTAEEFVSALFIIVVLFTIVVLGFLLFNI